MRALFVTAACFAATTVAHAQVKVGLGPLLGANLATAHSSSAEGYSYRFGWLVGAQAELSWGHFSVQPALALSQLGSHFNYRFLDPNDPNAAPTQYTRRLNYLVLPVPVAFSLKGTKTGPQVFAGPYIGVLLGGSENSRDLFVGDQVEITATKPGPTSRQLEVGLQAGAGFRVQNVLVRASYNLGLRSTEPTYTFRGAPVASGDRYNRSFQASASYLFSLR